MSSLFSVFDPISYFEIYLNWVIMVFIVFFIPFSYYMMNSAYNGIYMLSFSNVNKMFIEISFPNYMGIVYLSVMVFLYLVLSNLLGLFPFVFTSMAHPKVTLGLGLILWMSFFLMGWLKNFKMCLAHLVPEGSPLIMAPLMVIIESISHLIRPFTLSIRLAANMMAGHLIVGLLSKLSSINFYGFLSSFFFQSLLMMLEFGVCVIQGFVFSILLLLYALEYYKM